MAKDIISELKDKALELREAKLDLQAATGANRRSLRDLDAQGLLSDADSIWLEEFYPPRTRGGSDEVEV